MCGGGGGGGGKGWGEGGGVAYPHDIFFYFCIKHNIVGTSYKCLRMALLMTQRGTSNQYPQYIFVEQLSILLKKKKAYLEL